MTVVMWSFMMPRASSRLQWPWLSHKGICWCHTLVWHQQMPLWLSQGHWSREEALGIIKDHITTVMQHCKGKVYAWDVVNEAISDQGPDHPIRPDSFWTKVVGPDYVEKAFEFARAADPRSEEHTSELQSLRH